jgi:hypothetical protein
MPVVINEFEVVDNAPPPAPAAAPSALAAPPLDPMDLQRRLDELHELVLRTWSH